MPLSKSWVLRALALSRVVIAGQYPHPQVDVDVAILGGGASGTYAAVRLREDYGKSIILVEPEAVLVGILIDIASDQNC
jgi:heterodisulfide reductase subunit A-like polyferredoxin